MVVIPGSSARSVESLMTVSVVLVDGLKKKIILQFLFNCGRRYLPKVRCNSIFLFTLKYMLLLLSQFTRHKIK